MSSFQQLIQSGLRAVATNAAVTVKYRRGSDWVNVKAVAGSSTFGVSVENIIVTNSKSRDYLIDVCDLKLNGSQITPQRGDQIDETIGTKVNTYEVGREEVEQPYRFSDIGQTRYRVHTTLKGIANA